MSRTITVLGAGAVGVSTALHLQQRGWHVTLVDRREPGSETSFGNAGVINSGSVLPMNSPGLHGKLASLLVNNKPQLRYNLKYVVRHLPWMLQFLRASNTRAATRTANALHTLVKPSLEEHMALMQRTGNMHRLSQQGWLKVFRFGDGLDPGGFDYQTFERLGVTAERLNPAEINDLEPALKPIFQMGYVLPGGGFINNPGALIAEYARQFVADGGELRNEAITSLSSDDDALVCHTENGSLHCERLLVAAGPWSGELLATLGYNVPLGFERGYHAHFTMNDGVRLKHSVYDAHAGYVMGPMEYGVRLTTGVELNYRDAPSQPSQLEQVIPLMRQAIDVGPQTNDPIWRGSRPTLPDSKPVIGQAPRHQNLYLAFGHNHIGMMTGPITGKLIAQLVSGVTTDIDLQPFSPHRYLS
ncbi:MAG: FAD-binding oxidoreductase [Granulosicoccus sp.]